MANLELSLQPKQTDVYNSKATEILFGGAAGAGKAGSIEIPVPTPTGWKTMGSLEVGDKVFDENGIPCNVVAATEVMYDRPCYEVLFSDGTSIICDEQHQWVTMTDKERGAWTKRTPEYREKRRLSRPSRAKQNPVSQLRSTLLAERNKQRDYSEIYLPQPRGTVKTTLDIANTLFVRGDRKNHSIDVCKPVQYEKKKLIVEPWLLGFWLGDGTTLTGQITNIDDHNLQRIMELGYDLGKPRNITYTVLGLKGKLQSINVIDNKHIPREYLESSVDDRIELLHGLMDSDGYSSSDGRCVFYNTNKRIIDGFMELTKSLGINSTFSEDRAMLYGKDCGPCYNVYFNASFPIFSLPRRKERQSLAKEQYRRRYILTVTRVDSVPVRCIQVDSPRNMFLWSESFIPTHNSHLMRVMAICYSIDIPNCQTYLFRRTSPDLIANHLSGVSGFPTLLAPWIEDKLVTINYSKNEIRFANGSTIHLCHMQHEKDKFGYQGAEINFLLMDELTHFTDSMYRYLRGRVRLGGLPIPPAYKDVMPRIINGSNPGGEGHNWVKKTFIDAAPANTVFQAPKDEGGFKRAFIPAKLVDNKILTDNDPDYEDRLSGLGTAELVRAMKEGDWDIAAGGYFDDVWTREIHVLEPFKIPSSWRIDRSFDWGSSKPYSVGFWAESDGTEVTLNNGDKIVYPRGSLFRIAEIYGWNGKADEGTRETAAEIAQKIIDFQASNEWGSRVKPGAADSSIYNKENGDCIADDMKAAPYKITWIPADKKPGSRKVGWLQMRKMLKASYERPRETAGLYVFDTCLQFIRTVPTLPRDPNNSEDIHTKSEDHVGDESRYRVNSKVRKAQKIPVTGL